MGKANNPVNNSKLREKVSALHVLLILIGANLMFIFAPVFGLVYSFDSTFPDVNAWSVLAGGFAMVVFGFRGFFKKA